MTQPDDGSPDSAVGVPGVRRTQAERTTAMRQRLLDATIDCLVTHGYAGTTTQRVAQRAGVTRGAQLHHFPSREELVIAAVEHLAQERMRQAISELWRIEQSSDTPAAILDFLWEMHRSRFSVAAIELWVAARTDRVIAAQIQRVEPVVVGAVLTSVAQLLPEETARQDLRNATYTAMDAMRGLILTHFVDGDEDRLQRRWARARAWLRRDIEAALAGDDA